MQVPASKDSSTISELFVIPPVSNDTVEFEEGYDVPKPDFTAVQEDAQVKIQNLNNRRWILVNSKPSIIWPRIKSFVESRGLLLSVDDPMTGVMETVWLSLKDEPDSKDRYRFSVERGLHANTTEIHILQMTAPSRAPGAGNVNWTERSVNPDRERWMLDKLAGYLADSDRATVSLLAQSIGKGQKVRLVQPYQGEAYLRIAIDRERAIASVGGALSVLPFSVVDAYRGQGYFLVSYSPQPSADEEEQKKPGFFSRLFGLGDEPQPSDADTAGQYRVDVLAAEPEVMQVTVRNADGTVLEATLGNRLLGQIRKQLL